MMRREFIISASAAAAWPLAARAQQRERARRIGVLMPGVADNSEYEARNAAFLQGLGELGWVVGRNIQMDYRWGGGNVDRYRSLAEELLALTPDVILGTGTAVVTALQRATSIVPIVFANVIDPVGGGLVTGLAQPGGNLTGFASPELGFSGKLLELLKEVAPRLSPVAVLRDSAIASQIGVLGGIQSVAPSMGVELRAIDLRDATAIERAVTAFAHETNSGLIVAAAARAILYRELIVTLAARYRLPAIYSYRNHVTAGGLMSYGVDSINMYRQAASPHYSAH